MPSSAYAKSLVKTVHISLSTTIKSGFVQAPWLAQLRHYCSGKTVINNVVNIIIIISLLCVFRCLTQHKNRYHSTLPVLKHRGEKFYYIARVTQRLIFYLEQCILNTSISGQLDQRLQLQIIWKIFIMRSVKCQCFCELRSKTILIDFGRQLFNRKFHSFIHKNFIMHFYGYTTAHYNIFFSI
jgi:hypothetical protein